MQEYINNGVGWGWLIDRDRRYVEIYRSNQPVEALTSPEQLSGADVLPGLFLDMNIVW